MSKVSEIAAYVKQNPSLRVGIDGFKDPRNDDLSERRIRAVRSALIEAGVPSSKIQSGAYGDAKLAGDRRVEVLVRSDK
jgi:outer membrane protein OmpA-like peptidoglycan-associated protein